MFYNNPYYEPFKAYNEADGYLVHIFDTEWGEVEDWCFDYCEKNRDACLNVFQGFSLINCFFYDYKIKGVKKVYDN